MMRRIALAAALLVAASACGNSMFAAEDDALLGMGCPGNVATRSMTVTPAQGVSRGDPVVIEVTWSTWDRVSEPATVTLIVGSADEIEVEIPLMYNSTAEPHTYIGSQLNPFGAGAPAGTVSVLASGGTNEECMAPATAATTFELY